MKTNNGYLYEVQYTFLTTSHSVLLRMRNASDKLCGQKTQILWSITFSIRYCFSTAAMVARTRLSVTFYTHCPSCTVVTLGTIRRRGSTLTTKTNAFLYDNHRMSDIKNTWLHVRALDRLCLTLADVYNANAVWDAGFMPGFL
jgi:hypothetical protein